MELVGFQVAEGSKSNWQNGYSGPRNLTMDQLTVQYALDSYQAVVSWLLIIARQTLSSLAIDFQTDFKSKL